MPVRVIPMEEAYPRSTRWRSDAVKKYVKIISSSIKATFVLVPSLSG